MPVKISSLLPKKIQIDTGNGMLEVGSINLAGIVTLIQDFKEPLLQLFKGSGPNGQPDFIALGKDAPAMIVTIIAMGANAVGQEEDIAQLPLGVQITAAAEIWAQSVPEPKKLLSVLSTVLAQITPQSKAAPLREVSEIETITP